MTMPVASQTSCVGVANSQWVAVGAGVAVDGPGVMVHTPGVGEGGTQAERRTKTAMAIRLDIRMKQALANGAIPDLSTDPGRCRPAE